MVAVKATKHKQKNMETENIAVLIPILTVISGVVLASYIRKMIHLEKMAMIDKGVSPEFLASKKKGRSSAALRFGLLSIGVGLGFFIGYFLDLNYNMEEVGYFAMLFILGGVGLVVSYLIEQKKDKDNPTTSL
jgi:peptidoglycan/LPS O-acetylase OafA/YrhL